MWLNKLKRLVEIFNQYYFKIISLTNTTLPNNEPYEIEYELAQQYFSIFNYFNIYYGKQNDEFLLKCVKLQQYVIIQTCLNYIKMQAKKHLQKNVYDNFNNNYMINLYMKIHDGIMLCRVYEHAKLIDVQNLYNDVNVKCKLKNEDDLNHIKISLKRKKTFYIYWYVFVYYSIFSYSPVL